VRPQAISVGDANAVHFLLALTSGGSQQLAASEQESGDRVRVEGVGLNPGSDTLAF